MVWQILAMWVIVIGTITWFVRDERRLRREAALAQAAAYFAHAPKYRHVPVDEPVAVPLCAGGEPAATPARTGGLTEAHRKVLRGMLR